MANYAASSGNRPTVINVSSGKELNAKPSHCHVPYKASMHQAPIATCFRKVLYSSLLYSKVHERTKLADGFICTVFWCAYCWKSCYLEFWRLIEA